MTQRSTFMAPRATGPRYRRGVTLRHGDLVLDPGAQLAVVRGRCVELTRFECQILACLVRRRGSLVTKGELTSSLYGLEPPPPSNVIEVLVARLRRKLDPDDERPFIQTLRGRGYRLRG